MRSLRKEKKKVYVAKKLPPVQVLDEDGIETGEYYSIYDLPKILFLNIKPITDIAERNSFGEDVNSILKTVYTPFDVNDKISEFDAVWIDAKPNGNLSDGDLQNPMNNDYFVFKALDTGGQISAYFKKNVGSLNEN